MKNIISDIETIFKNHGCSNGNVKAMLHYNTIVVEFLGNDDNIYGSALRDLFDYIDGIEEKSETLNGFRINFWSGCITSHPDRMVMELTIRMEDDEGECDDTYSIQNTLILIGYSLI